MRLYCKNIRKIQEDTCSRQEPCNDFNPGRAASRLRGNSRYRSSNRDRSPAEATVYIMKTDQEPVNKVVSAEEINKLTEEGFLLKTAVLQDKEVLIVTGRSERGLLYGTFHLLRQLQMGKEFSSLDYLSNPGSPLRMINHWDNLDGSIERGYAGNSIFYEGNELTANLERVKDYARLVASLGLNSVVINNVNVHQEETKLITDRLPMVKTIADIFRNYGIVTF